MKKEDIELYFYRSRGPGGQRKNKKETAVKAIHLPTGIVSRATEYRSQAKNRELALQRLAEKVEASRKPRKKRIPTKKPFYAREKELKEKKIRSERKKLRKKVDQE